MSTLIAEMIGTSLAMACFLHLVVAILREQCVAGTWRRYVYATVQWALVAPALANAPFQLLFDSDGVFWDAMTVLNFVVTLMVLRKLINDEDDNWWRRKRKQLRRYLGSFGLQPNLAGVRG